MRRGLKDIKNTNKLLAPADALAVDQVVQAALS